MKVTRIAGWMLVVLGVPIIGVSMMIVLYSPVITTGPGYSVGEVIFGKGLAMAILAIPAFLLYLLMRRLLKNRFNHGK